MSYQGTTSNNEITEEGSAEYFDATTWIDSYDGAQVFYRTQHDDRVENRLYKAIRKDDWEKAREIVKTEKVPWTSKLNNAGYTALHFAVGTYKDNEVVRDILMAINSKLLVDIVVDTGANPVHTAALFGNTEALEIMLNSNQECLFKPNKDDLLPIHLALAIPAKKTFDYLFKQMKSHEDEYDILFKDMCGLNLLHQVIDTELIDVASELINNYPRLATKLYRDKTALERIIRKPELFYSGTETRYSSLARFFYHIIPIENNSSVSSDTGDIENQEIPKKDKLVTKHTRRWLHDVISRICVKVWKATLLHGKHPPN